MPRLSRHLRGGSFTSDSGNLFLLLQQRQNAPVTGQRCAGLSPCSADRDNHVTRDPWRASSPLRSGLGFRYTQVSPINHDFVTNISSKRSTYRESGYLKKGYLKNHQGYLKRSPIPHVSEFDFFPVGTGSRCRGQQRSVGSRKWLRPTMHQENEGRRTRKATNRNRPLILQNQYQIRI